VGYLTRAHVASRASEAPASRIAGTPPERKA
jgi:hypothetical protein